MKVGPFKIEKKGKGRVINAPGMVITSDETGKVSIGLEAIAAQLNRAYEAGGADQRLEADKHEAKLSDTHRVQRDGWKSIAEALIAIGMGYQMRGFGDTPPREILDDLIGGTETVTGKKIVDGVEKEVTEVRVIAPRSDEEIIGAIRDSLMGRAWRVRGSQGAGTCDYPLCPNRNPRDLPEGLKRVAPGFVEIALVAGVKLHVCSSNLAIGATPSEHTTVHECHRWAQWVSARAVAKRIEVAR